MSNAPNCPTAFPTFDDKQMGVISSIAELAHFNDGDILIQQGEKNYAFFVVQSGEVDIVERIDDLERLIATHGPRSFTGDVDMLTGRSAVITAVARGPVDAYRLCAKRLREILHACQNVSETLLNAFQLRRKLLSTSGHTGVRLIGKAGERQTTLLTEFFFKNHVPHSFIDADSTIAKQILSKTTFSYDGRPIVQCNGVTIAGPALQELAECIGISHNVDGRTVDLVIVGAGPAGLAAAVYAASEGIETLVIDSFGPGGQAGCSSRIENFIGFPSGLSGNDLANRGYLQALKFGAEFVAPVSVDRIETTDDGMHHLYLNNAQHVTARCVIAATGVSYRQLNHLNNNDLEGAGLYYSATSVESRLCENSTAVVVGGGNSAGQAAMFLATSAEKVLLLIRGDDLRKSMSEYLCRRIENHPNIEVRKHSELIAAHGRERLEAVTIRNSQTQNDEKVDCRGVFIFIGAVAHTDWLPSEVLRDEKGFVVTGATVATLSHWPLDREPCELETSIPGIFAAGDVRSGTTKRCGFAVGDGSLAITCVHRYLTLQS